MVFFRENLKKLYKYATMLKSYARTANIMPKPKDFKHLIEQLCDVLPTHVTTMKKDFEKNCQRIIPSFLDKLDLVTREEFDTQTKVLARTRKKLEELEKQIDHLESLLKSKKK
jgi:BMFP domain-containing protein YqiC